MSQLAGNKMVNKKVNASKTQVKIEETKNGH
jgi:hypothetical protein